MLKTIVPKFCLDLFARLKDIAEKQVPAKLKPIEVLIFEDSPYHGQYPRYFSTSL